VKETVMRCQDRDRISLVLLGALAGAVLVASACSGGRRPLDEGDADVDADADLDGDADADADAWMFPDSDIESPEEVPNCGDGVVDEGEQCDDHNRLNGDGCDWLCRLGDGERPPTEPDPAAEEYVPSGDPEHTDTAGSPFYLQSRFTLTWSGTQFAAAYSSDDEILFHRFDAAGHLLDSDWVSPIISLDTMSNAELVWNGDGYGLFYIDGSSGLFFLRLDLAGKPIGAPVLVVDEANVLFPAADRAPEGYVVVWSHCEHWEGSVNLLLVGPDGTTEGLPEPLVLTDSMEEACDASADVAAGQSGYAVSLRGADEDVRLLCVDDDLTEVTSSGILGGGHPAEVKWTGDSYVTAWNSLDLFLGTCVARFTDSGFLEGPPVCTPLGNLQSVLLAAGDNGLALVFRSGIAEHSLSFVRTDRFGVPVGLRYDFTDEDTYEGAPISIVGTTWADDGFAIAFALDGGTLMLQRFVRGS
jgi:cysteine-rich repeat protein